LIAFEGRGKLRKRVSLCKQHLIPVSEPDY